MGIPLSILVILTASVALIKGVDLFVKSVSRLAVRFKISAYTVSFFLVAVATSIPETVVAIGSSLEGNSILSFGNAIGSNIALLTIIVAIPCLMTVGLPTRTILNSKDIYYTALSSLLPVILILDGTLGKNDGIVLLLSYAVYVVAVLRKATGLEQIKDGFENVKVLKEIGLFLVGLLILLGASELIVLGAENLSVAMGISLGFIGLTVTALGTSLPEISYSISATRQGQKETVLGDVVGSIVANSTLVLGITALIYPVSIEGSSIGVTTLFFLVLSLLVFLRFARTKEKLDTVEGISLMLLYLVFLVVSFMAVEGVFSIGF